MGWLKHLSMTCIILSAAVCVSCQELASTLREGNLTCPGEEVIFKCTIRGSSTLPVLVLEWRSAEYIGQDGSLQLSTTDSLGEVEESMMDGIVTATATLINSTNIGGVLILESTLRIVANEASVVTCRGTNGVTESIEFSISAIPEAPQIISATEISPLPETACIILVQWNPPANSDLSDISHYIVYVPSRNIREVVDRFTTSTLPVPNCGDDLRIQVAAVNRIGCVGMNSSAVQPVLLNIPTGRGSTTTKGGSATTASTTVDGSLSVGAILGITIAGTALVIGVPTAIVVIVLIICCVMYRKRNAKQATDGIVIPMEQQNSKQEDQLTQLMQEVVALKQQQAMESELRRYSVIGYDLKELYKALISQSRSIIRRSARSLLRKLTEDPPQNSEDVIKGALIQFLKELNGDSEMEEAIYTLNSLAKVQFIHSSIEEMVRRLADGAGAETGFDSVIEVIEQEIPTNVKDILKKLCEQLRTVKDVNACSQPDSNLSSVSRLNHPNEGRAHSGAGSYGSSASGLFHHNEGRAHSQAGSYGSSPSGLFHHNEGRMLRLSY